MKKLLILVSCLMFSTLSVATENQGVNSALSWLEIVDAGNYHESWQQTAPLFQSQVTSDKWAKLAASARAPFGQLLERKVKKSSSHTSLPGAPDGEYMVITLNASYQHKKSATETVTVTKVQDNWHVVGYFIK